MADKKILIVEDEEDVMELIRYNLDKEGFHCDVASNGREALKKASATLPDLVLLDLMLPEINGLDVCKTLKKETKTATVPVVMQSTVGKGSTFTLHLPRSYPKTSIYS